MCQFVLSRSRLIVFCVCVAVAYQTASDTLAQENTTWTADVPIEIGEETFVRLRPVPVVTFPAGTDSNSPAFWERLDNGLPGIHVINSTGHPNISKGSRIGRLASPQAVTFTDEIDGGRWMEAVLQDVDGTLYGYYHNEPRSRCRYSGKTAPRIGAARSRDRGLTWDDLGIILEAPLRSEHCNTRNHYFEGGVGDFSVVLNQEQTEAYFFFSAYSGGLSQQGVGVARMLWQHRDQPRGNLAVWDGNIWRYPTVVRGSGPMFRAAGPMYPATISWHDRSGTVDAFWGPSVHWNTYLNKYVMLLNRASSSEWAQEGVYIALATTLDDPFSWTQPVRLLAGGPWYPQVLGLEPGAGTDKQAGRVARLFVGGASEYLLVFQNSGVR